MSFSWQNVVIQFGLHYDTFCRHDHEENIFFDYAGVNAEGTSPNTPLRSSWANLLLLDAILAYTEHKAKTAELTQSLAFMYHTILRKCIQASKRAHELTGEISMDENVAVKFPENWTSLESLQRSLSLEDNTVSDIYEFLISSPLLEEEGDLMVLITNMVNDIPIDDPPADLLAKKEYADDDDKVIVVGRGAFFDDGDASLSSSHLPAAVPASGLQFSGRGVQHDEVGRYILQQQQEHQFLQNHVVQKQIQPHTKQHMQQQKQKQPYHQQQLQQHLGDHVGKQRRQTERIVVSWVTITAELTNKCETYLSQGHNRILMDVCDVSTHCSLANVQEWLNLLVLDALLCVLLRVPTKKRTSTCFNQHRALRESVKGVMAAARGGDASHLQGKQGEQQPLLALDAALTTIAVSDPWDNILNFSDPASKLDASSGTKKVPRKISAKRAQERSKAEQGLCDCHVFQHTSLKSVVEAVSFCTVYLVVVLQF